MPESVWPVCSLHMITYGGLQTNRTSATHIKIPYSIVSCGRERGLTLPLTTPPFYLSLVSGGFMRQREDPNWHKKGKDRAT